MIEETKKIQEKVHEELQKQKIHYSELSVDEYKNIIKQFTDNEDIIINMLGDYFRAMSCWSD